MLQCALVELLKTWGVYPDCVIGHSSGEVAAAYACGALSLGDATRLVYHRATLQQRRAGSGRMLAIGLDRAGVELILEFLDIPFRPGEARAPRVENACENAPANTVVCGPSDDLRPIISEAERRSLQHRLIPGNIAFHSRAMDPLEDDARAALAFLDRRSFDVEVPFVSSVTGTHVERLDSAYWWSNIRRPVRFAAAMETIKREHRPHLPDLAPGAARRKHPVLPVRCRSRRGAVGERPGRGIRLLSPLARRRVAGLPLQPGARFRSLLHSAADREPDLPRTADRSALDLHRAGSSRPGRGSRRQGTVRPPRR